MSIVDKVAALLRLAEGRGTTAAEAATAASVAQLLMARHRITRAELHSGDPDPIRHHLEPLHEGARLVSWRRRLIAGIARINGCRVVIRQRGSWRSLELVGRDGDAKVARYLVEYVAREIDRLARRAVAERRELGAAGGARAFGSSFRLAAVAEVVGRLERDTRAAPAGTYVAIINVARDGEALDKFVASVATGTEARWSPSGEQDRGGRAAGRRAGRSLPLRRGVPGGDDAPPRPLLPQKCCPPGNTCDTRGES